MCGIVGVCNFSKLGITSKDREIFVDLLLAGAVRGVDGTGAFFVDSHEKCRSVKKVGGPDEFLKDKVFSEVFKKNFSWKQGSPDDVILVGHNRAASVGTISTQTAHPFMRKHIVMVHNGTIRQYSNIPDMKKFSVDSEALCNSIAVLGIDKTIKELQGSYAIVYYDVKEKTLNFIRNDERPLSFASSADGKNMYFASEGQMLRWILGRASIEGVHYTPLKPDTLLSFPVDGSEPQIREIKGHQTYSQYYSGYNWQSVEEGRLTTVLDKYYNKTSRVKHLPSPAKNQPTIKGELKKLKKMGIVVSPVQTWMGLGRGEEVCLKVVDYSENNPKKESFIITGENRNFPEAEFKFHVSGGKNLDSWFEAEELVAKVKHILHYPNAEVGFSKYTIWVDSVQKIPKEAQTPLH